MKKVVKALFALSLSALLASCGCSTQEPASSSQQPSPSSQPQQTSEPPAASSQGGDSSVAPGPDSSQEPSTPAQSSEQPSQSSQESSESSQESSASSGSESTGSESSQSSGSSSSTPVVNQYTVTYHSNGGREIEPETVDENERFTKPTDPTRSWYFFRGWYTDEALTNAYDWNTPATANIDLYAKWEEEETFSGKVDGLNIVLTDVKGEQSTAKAEYHIHLVVGETLSIARNAVDLNFYEWDDEKQEEYATGTQYIAQRNGTYIVYVNSENQLWVTEPGAPATDVRATVDGEPIELEDVKEQGSTDRAVYKIELSEGEVIAFKEGNAVLLCHLIGEEPETQGAASYTAIRDGEYTFYLNKEDQIWISVPVIPVTDVHATVDDEPIELENVKPESSADRAVYKIQLNYGQEIAFKEGNAVLLCFVIGDVEESEGEPSYTAIRDGEYTFYLNQQNEIWIAEPQDPEKIITGYVNEEPIELEDIKPESSTDKAQYRLSLNRGDKLTFKEGQNELLFYRLGEEGPEIEGDEYHALYNGVFKVYINLEGQVWLFPADPATDKGFKLDYYSYFNPTGPHTNVDIEASAGEHEAKLQYDIELKLNCGDVLTLTDGEGVPVLFDKVEKESPAVPFLMNMNDGQFIVQHNATYHLYVKVMEGQNEEPDYISVWIDIDPWKDCALEDLGAALIPAEGERSNLNLSEVEAPEGVERRIEATVASVKKGDEILVTYAEIPENPAALMPISNPAVAYVEGDTNLKYINEKLIVRLDSDTPVKLTIDFINEGNVKKIRIALEGYHIVEDDAEHYKDFYIVSNATGWEEHLHISEYGLVPYGTVNGHTQYRVLSVGLAAGTEFKIVDKTGENWHGNNGSNYVVENAGTYDVYFLETGFKGDPELKIILEAPKHEDYLIMYGQPDAEEWDIMSFNYIDYDYYRPVELSAGTQAVFKVEKGDTYFKYDDLTDEAKALFNNVNGNLEAKEDGLYTFYLHFDQQGGMTISATRQVVVKHTIHLYNEDGTDWETTTVNDGEPYWTVSHPDKDGYQFVGWFKAQVGGEKIGDFIEMEEVTADFEAYARFEIVNYNIEYHLDGGSFEADPPATFNIESTVVLPSPTKEGKVFMGWYYDEECSSESAIPENTLDKQYLTGEPGSLLDVYAKWGDANKFTMTFHSNGGSAVVAIQADQNEAFIQPSDPSNFGYEFAGWYTDDGTFEHAYVWETLASANVDLYAKWVLATRTITYHNMDEVVNPNPTSYTIEDATIILQDVAKDGYIFGGWYLDGAFENDVSEIDTSTEIVGDLYAMWIEKSIYYLRGDATENGWGDVNDNTRLLNYPNDNNYGLIENVTLNKGSWRICDSSWHNNYGWTYNEYESRVIGGAKDNFSKADGGDDNIYCNVRGIYNIYLTQNGYISIELVEALPDLAASFGVHHGKGSDPWTTAPMNLVPLTPAEEATLKVKYDLVIALDENEKFGLQAANAAESWYSYSNLDAESKELMGGSEGNDIEVPSTSTYKITVTYSKTDVVSIHVEVLKNTVTFINALDDSEIGTTKLEIGENLAEPANPEAPLGYVFDGWYENKTGGVPVAFPYEVENDVTLYARFSAIQYTVSFNANGGSGEAMQNLVFTYDGQGHALTANAYSKTGYVFSGWNTAADGSGSAYADATPVTYLSEASVTLYAQWNAITYKVRFNGNEPTSGEMADQTLTYDLPANLTQVAYEKSGYTFAGWALTNEGAVAHADQSEVVNLANAQDAIVNLYAIWTQKKVLTYYETKGGTALGTVLAEEGQKFEAPDNPSREGYSFVSWKKVSDDSAFNFDTEVAGASDIAIYAVWNAHSYAVSFDKNGGSGEAMANQNFTYGEEKDLTANSYTKEGYDFLGWALTEDGEVAYADEASVSNLTATDGGSVTLFAKWAIHSYTLTLNLNDGVLPSEVESTIQYTVEQAGGYVELPTPSKEFYGFAGWYDNSEFTGEPITQYAVSNKKDAGLYAKWTFAVHYGQVGDPNWIDIKMNLTNDIPDGYTEQYYIEIEMTANYSFGIMDAGSWFSYGALEDSCRGVFNENDGNAVTKGPGVYHIYFKVNSSNGNHAIYVHKVADKKTMSFVTNGGSEIAPIQAEEGLPFEKPTAPTKDGKVFMGWYTEEALENAYNWNAGASANITLYAKWADGIKVVGSIAPGMSWNYADGVALIGQNGIWKAEVAVSGEGASGSFKLLSSENDWLSNNGSENMIAEFAEGAYIICYDPNAEVPVIVVPKTYVRGEAVAEGWGTPDAGNALSISYEEGIIAEIKGIHIAEAKEFQLASLNWGFKKYFADLAEGGAADNFEVVGTGGNLGAKDGKSGYYDIALTSDYKIRIRAVANGTVTYHLEGGIGEFPGETIPLVPGAKFEEPASEPTKVGCVFLGWYEKEGEVYAANPYDFSEAAVESLDLYAKWEASKFTVVWKDYDGTVLETDNNVVYGTVPTYDGATPSRAADAQYTYTFDAWSPAVAAVTANAEYVATYSSVVNKYTVVWHNEAGDAVLETDTNVPYGTVPSYDGEDPTKAGFNFDGWSASQGGDKLESLPAVSGNADYYAHFSAKAVYTITWYDDEGVKINSTAVEEDVVPTHANPSKAETAEYTYAFAGWAASQGGEVIANLPAASAAASYYAVFTPTKRSYAIAFVGDNAVELQNSNVLYGVVPAYAGSEPVKAEDNGHTYAFDGWEDSSHVRYAKGAALPSVSGAETYTAVFAATAKQFTVELVENGGSYGSQPEVTAYTYGVGATLPSDITKANYTFGGWYVDSEFNGDPVTSIGVAEYGNRTFYAKWTANFVYGIKIGDNEVIGFVAGGEGAYHLATPINVLGSKVVAIVTPSEAIDSSKISLNDGNNNATKEADVIKIRNDAEGVDIWLNDLGEGNFGIWVEGYKQYERRIEFVGERDAIITQKYEAADEYFAYFTLSAGEEFSFYNILTGTEFKGIKEGSFGGNASDYLTYNSDTGHFTVKNNVVSFMAVAYSGTESVYFGVANNVVTVNGWDAGNVVYAYAFKDGGASKNHEWPGEQMYCSSVDGKYYVSLTADDFESIIFSDGSTQTADIDITGRANLDFSVSELPVKNYYVVKGNMDLWGAGNKMSWTPGVLGTHIVDLTTSNEFKVVYNEGGSDVWLGYWDVVEGGDLRNDESKDNIKVKEAGTYQITLNGDHKIILKKL